MLLDIVAKSLYSESEVFIRELISNASDAIEKFRYVANTSEPDKLVESDRKLEIHLETNKQDRRLVIQDKGIGEFVVLLPINDISIIEVISRNDEGRAD